jgi:signal transduction histidine kinase
MFSVRDNGIGMNDAERAKLFRIDEAHATKGTRKEEGTGLGLILCKEFINRHGGKIWVESEPEKGSTFFFTIPGVTE